MYSKSLRVQYSSNENCELFPQSDLFSVETLSFASVYGLDSKKSWEIYNIDESYLFYLNQIGN